VTRPARCPHGTCQWVKARTRETCTVCGNVFPCPRTGCGHIDCHDARGEPLPDWITIPVTESTP